MHGRGKTSGNGTTRTGEAGTMRYRITFYKEIVETIHWKTLNHRIEYQIDNIKADDLTAVITEIRNKGYVVSRMTIPSAFPDYNE